jgi:hypothetical protein
VDERKQQYCKSPKANGSIEYIILNKMEDFMKKEVHIWVAAAEEDLAVTAVAG